ncbi:MAG: aconitate hydratase AcnA [Propionibacteriaceae bacterium]|nr:aconitate hydratase AcnA [Propionibacteriaceae bacterium]
MGEAAPRSSVTAPEGLARLTVGETTVDYVPLSAAAPSANLPFSLKILLEDLLRHRDGVVVTDADVDAVAQWAPGAPARDIPFLPYRVVMQDFTGVPCVVDLAAMRSAVAARGGDPAAINPACPVELVIDHSVIADHFGGPEAFAFNTEREYERNRERYQFLRWGQSAFDHFAVVPPGTGIVHQVNIERLARVVATVERDGRTLAFPDTCVGTDSHTTMVNGLGVLGWGVGGIEAEAAMLGQPIPLVVPDVVGLKLTGELPHGVTSTDLVLTITELLRQVGVVGKFVEFYGPGVAAVPVANRCTIGNMSPEYGSTAAIFPLDGATLDYLRLTGRSEEHCRLVEAYAKEQGLWHDPAAEPDYTVRLELDLATVEPSIAGPKRPQDRIPLRRGGESFRQTVAELTDDPTAAIPLGLTDASGDQVVAHHGAVGVAAITSCTNTSNPSVMVAAGLVAKKAVERGLRPAPWVKTTLSPGSQVVMDYLSAAGLTPYLADLGFALVGYGCVTCIGNTGPLVEEVTKAVDDEGLVVAAVLSGNRNFEGRISPDTRVNYLASPPLVVAYALAGTVDIDLTSDPIGHDAHGAPVYLTDLWPSEQEIDEVVAASINSQMFRDRYAHVFDGDERWRALEVSQAEVFDFADESTYIRQAPYFDDMPDRPAPITDIAGARVLLSLGDSVTTDHISPAGAIKAASPAGRYLSEHGVEPRDFNSYGSRRGNHEVMVRGTFANIRLRNQLVPGSEGGVTKDFIQPDAPVTTVYEASRDYLAAGVPLIILAGKEYGSGSSRDWAAKGTALLGVKAVIASSYERIHRSNLVGMGVLPLQFPAGSTAASLGLTGEETYSIEGIAAFAEGRIPSTVTVRAEGGKEPIVFTADVRVDTVREADYIRHGGILAYVVRQLTAVAGTR